MRGRRFLCGCWVNHRVICGGYLCKEKLLKPGWGGWEGKRGAQTMAGRCQSQHWVKSSKPRKSRSWAVPAWCPFVTHLGHHCCPALLLLHLWMRLKDTPGLILELLCRFMSDKLCLMSIMLKQRALP